MEGSIVIFMLAAGVVLIAIILRIWGKNKIKKAHCRKCRAQMKDGWSICPYCGCDIMGGK